MELILKKEQNDRGNLKECSKRRLLKAFKGQDLLETTGIHLHELESFHF